MLIVWLHSQEPAHIDNSGVSRAVTLVGQLQQLAGPPQRRLLCLWLLQGGPRRLVRRQPRRHHVVQKPTALRRVRRAAFEGNSKFNLKSGN